MPRSCTQEIHAQRVWQMLAAAAKNRQILTYEHVAQEIGVVRWGLANILGHVVLYCRAMQRPYLTLLVVSQRTGKPEERLLALMEMEGKDLDAERERVFAFDWWAYPAPNATELHRTYEIQMRILGLTEKDLDASNEPETASREA